MNALIPT